MFRFSTVFLVYVQMKMAWLVTMTMKELCLVHFMYVKGKREREREINKHCFLRPFNQNEDELGGDVLLNNIFLDCNKVFLAVLNCIVKVRIWSVCNVGHVSYRKKSGQYLLKCCLDLLNFWKIVP